MSETSVSVLSFLESLDQAVFVVSTGGAVLAANSAARDMVGDEAESIAGSSFTDLFEEASREDVRNLLKKQAGSRKGSAKRYILVAPDGRRITVNLSSTPSGLGRDSHYIVTVKDISGLKISEARKLSLRILSESNRCDAGQLAKIALDETISLTGCTIGFFGDFREGDSELTDIVWASRISHFEAARAPSVMEFSGRGDLVKVIREKQPVYLTDEYIRKMGPEASFITNGIVVPLVDEGDIVHIIGLGNKDAGFTGLDIDIISILWDSVIAEMRRSKANRYLAESQYEYKNLFNSSRDALLLYNLAESRIVLCNEAAVEMFGYRSVKEILARTPLELSAEVQPDGTRSAEALAENPVRAASEPISIPRWMHKRKSGETFISEVSLAPLVFRGEQTILATVRDISQRLKVEMDLERSEESFDMAMREAGLGTWDYDVRGRRMMVGRGFSQIVGQSISGTWLAADEWLKQIHPDDMEQVGEHFVEHIEGKSGDYRSQYRIKTGDGTYKWIQTAGRAIERDEEGRALRLVGIIMDIDDSRRLAREIEDTRNFLETIISSIESILFVKDVEGRYLLVNRAFTEKLGVSASDVIGKTDRECGVAFDLDSSLSDQLVVKEGVEYTFEKELRLVDGRDYDYLVTKRPIKDRQGSVYAQVGLATDITRIKQLEKDLRNNVFSLDAAINGTGSGLWDWNPKSDELILNDNWFMMLGFTRNQFNRMYTRFGFKTFADHIHPEDVVKVEEALKEHYGGLTEYYKTEIRMKTADGGWKWILATGKVWEWDEEHNPTRMVGIHIDIDYRVRTEEQLKQALLKAEESDRLKSAFLANMSHEIRTPMNGIIGFLDLLDREGIPADQRKEYMKIIRSSSNQLLDVVNDIVDISKIEAGQVTIRKSRFDIELMVEELRMQYRPAVEDKGLWFKTEIRVPASHRMIVTDQTKLRQVISNLVSNAIKFTSRGGLTVRCTLEGNEYLFCVEDTGSGIPVSLRKKVFERFVQADMGLSRLQEGTGLGLSISKAYIEKMGGTIWLESEEGNGSSFCFRLPVDPGIVEAAPKPAAVIPDEGSEGVVLIVEDEIYNYLFVEQILQNYGMRVIHAETGSEAVEMVSENRAIGVVLMDIRLPGIDGYETTRMIKEIRPGLPVIALTALALSGDREKALEAGCDDYLKKPVLREELLSVIKRVFPGG